MPGSKIARDVQKTGTVTEVGWDDTVGAAQVAIECQSGELLAVEMDGVGLELAELIEEDVSISGTIWFDELGNRWLKVTRFAVQYRRWEDDDPWGDAADEELDLEVGSYSPGRSGTWH